MNKQLALTIVWLVCICLGVVSVIHEAQELLGAEVSGIFGQIMPHYPSQRIAAIACPVEWANNKPGVVSASVQNPLDKPLNYKVQISTYPRANPPHVEPSKSVIIPANESATFNWSLDPSGVPGYYVSAQVVAYSDEDLAKSGYHFWPSSYVGNCGIRLVNNPAFSALRLRVLGGVLGIVMGSVLAYVPNRPLTRRLRWAAVFIGTVILVMAGPPLYYIVTGAYQLMF